MSKKIQLTIATPCHENWDAMTPVEQGKFCGSCQKQVVDFSNMSDRQVAEFFKKPSTGSLCGRFMTDQLDRDIEIPKKRIPWVKYFFQIALPAFLFSMKASSQNKKGKVAIVAQDTAKKGGVFADQRITLGMVARPESFKPFTTDTIAKPVKTQIVEILKGEINVQDTLVPPPCDLVMGGISFMPPAKTNIYKKEITGKVIGENGEPVSFANIETNKKNKNIIADEDGSFTIKRDLLHKTDSLFITSAGYQRKAIAISKNDFLSEELYVELKADNTLPEVVVRSSAIIMGKISRPVTVTVVKGQITVAADNKNKTAEQIPILPADNNNSFLVYPNPVIAGSALNLSLKKTSEGYYELQIINQSGQVIQQKEIWIDAEARVLNIEVPNVASGNYFLILTDKKTGKKFSEKIIIQ